jgi:hypothetical protein
MGHVIVDSFHLSSYSATSCALSYSACSTSSLQDVSVTSSANIQIRQSNQQLTPQRNSRVSHNSTTRSTMPMSLSSRNVHDIPNQKLPRRFAFGANKARSDRDRQDLPALVGVPERAGARSEAHVVAHAVVGRENGIHVHCSCEGFGGLLGSRVGLVGGAD